MLTFLDAAVHPDNANANATTTIPWGSSKAKAFLQEELAKGDPSSHPFWVKTPAEVWASDQQFREYPKNNFCNNLRNYRKKTRVQMQSIKFEDAAAVQHNNLFRFKSDKNNRGNPRMHNHPGKSAAGNANGRKPAELKKDRPEYAEFGTIQFCKAVNKERQKQRTEKFWAPKRNKEGALRNIRRREQQLSELGMNPDN